MEKIVVVGLGIIGSSICRSLKKAGFYIAGKDIDKEVVEFAKEQNYIDEIAADLSEFDTVFLAVPPRVALDLLDNGKFKDNALVTDICGIKKELEIKVFSKERNYHYISIHPMAGKETSGIKSSSENLFKNANLVIIKSEKTKEEDLNKIVKYASEMGFGRLTYCTAEEHDKKIALTSQLAHIVSNAYVKSSEVKKCEGFTGGSFQDMTRIAGVDENMWSQLYMLNKDNILCELDELITHLTAYKVAIENNDENSLKEELKNGRICRESIKHGNR